METTKALQLYLNACRGAKSPATVQWYQSKLSSLVEFLADQPIEQTTIHQLNEWRATLATQPEKYTNHPTRRPIAQPIAQNTLRGYVRAARTWFKWLKKMKLIQEDIYTDFDLPAYVQIPRSGISEDHRDTLLTAAQGNPRDYAILRFLASTGCRLGGCASLTMDRLSLKNHKAIVTEKGRGGQNKYRSVYFDAETAHALARYLVARPETAIPTVFLEFVRGGKNPARAGLQPITGHAIYQMIKRYAKPLSIPLANPHSWRHGYARGAIRRGIPLSSLAQILGHSSEQVTADIYGTLNEDELQSMAEAYTWLNVPAVKRRSTI